MNHSITSQEGGTCYAHATTRALHKLLTILGTKPNFNLILDHIIARHGYDGAHSGTVLKKLLSEGPCPDFIPADLFRHLRYRRIMIDEFNSNVDSRIEEALLCGREPIVSVQAPLYKLLRILRNSETTTIGDRDAPPTSEEDSDTKNFEQAGHAINLAQALPDGSMRFKNSWGTCSGQSGLFSIASSSVLNFTPEYSPAEFVDIYADETNLPVKYLKALRDFQFPSIREDSAAWFDFYDLNGSGSLDLLEVRGALLYTLPDPSEVDWWLRDAWSIFADKKGLVSKKTFLESNGLCDSIIMQLRHVDFAVHGREPPFALARSFSREEAERIADEADREDYSGAAYKEGEIVPADREKFIAPNQPEDEDLQLAMALSSSLAEAHAESKRKADVDEQIRADEKLAKDLYDSFK